MKNWEKLAQEQQNQFKEKARYLLERGYINRDSLEEFVKEIYLKSS